MFSSRRLRRWVLRLRRTYRVPPRALLRFQVDSETKRPLFVSRYLTGLRDLREFAMLGRIGTSSSGFECPRTLAGRARGCFGFSWFAYFIGTATKLKKYGAWLLYFTTLLAINCE